MPLKKTLEKFALLERAKLISSTKKLFQFTDEPHFFQYSCSYSKEDYDEDNGGVALDIDKEKAMIRAMGECVERYCLEKAPKNLLVDSFYNLQSRALNPGRFINFRKEDIGKDLRGYLEKLSRTPLTWVEGLDMITKDKILIPAQLVYVPFDNNEPMIRPQISTGAAAHENLEQAIINGTLEVIERDSFMLKYLSRDKLPIVKLGGKLKELENYFKRYQLELRIFETTTDINIPSIMCVNIDRTGEGPAISIGLATKFSQEDAILRAIIESQQVRQWIRHSYIVDEMPLVKKPFEIKSIKDRGYYWYPLEKINDLNFLQGDQISFSKGKKEKSSVKNLTALLRSKNIGFYAVDITTPQIRNAGFNVVKTVLPELHPLFLYEDYPCLYSKRLEENLKGREINLDPHPFM